MDYQAVDRYLDNYQLRQLEMERVYEMEGWIDQPQVEVHFPEDYDTPLRYSKDEVKEIAQQIRDRVHKRLHPSE